MKFTVFAFTALLLAACNSTPTDPSVAPQTVPAASAAVVDTMPTPLLPSSIDEAVSNSARSEKNRNRDKYRHPVETLNFFGLRPNMNVVEVSPGEGWYLEILAPLLMKQGHYTAAARPAKPGDREVDASIGMLSALKKSHPEYAQNLASTEFAPPSKVDIAPPGSADMILTFRNVHNWMGKGAERAAFQSFYKALKPGGVLGVVEHRADAKQKRDLKASSGYVLEKDVIALAKKVGFKLDKKSEMNANPKDTKNYPEGVWTLPPSLRLKDQDREKYSEIGESDRMTLRFIKK